MQNKIYLVLYNLFFLAVVILLFTFTDSVIHTFRAEWAVPEYYFRNKIIFSLIFGVILFFVLGRSKIQSSLRKAAIFSLTICTLLQIRYLISGYDLSFVLIFWVIHTVILFALSWLLFQFVIKK